MRLFRYTLFIFTTLLLSCNSSEYSEEEKTKLEEAQQIHNEAMATFAEAKRLLAELTEVRAEIRQSTGLEAGGPTNQQNPSGDAAIRESGKGNTDQNSTGENTGVDNARGNAAGSGNTGNNQAPNNKKSRSDTSTTNKVTATDTATVDNETRKILDQLNKAQNDLLTWMRDIYTVPGLNEGTDGEKTKDPAVGMDFDSRRLSKDIEFKEYPEDAGIDEIHKKQQEMKEKIERIYDDMKKAIAEGKKNSVSTK